MRYCNGYERESLLISFQEKVLDVADGVSSPSSVASPTSVPYLRISRPSMTSEDSETLALASADADFARLAKAR